MSMYGKWYGTAMGFSIALLAAMGETKLVIALGIIYGVHRAIEAIAE